MDKIVDEIVKEMVRNAPRVCLSGLGSNNTVSQYAVKKANEFVAMNHRSYELMLELATGNDKVATAKKLLQLSKDAINFQKSVMELSAVDQAYLLGTISAQMFDPCEKLIVTLEKQQSEQTHEWHELQQMAMAQAAAVASTAPVGAAVAEWLTEDKK